jgi:SAM-dependent methyltransferase
MYAYAAQRGERFDAYDAHETGCWPQQPPVFGGQRFDAIIACHFIEHLDDPAGFVSWAIGRLTERGRIYLEWPSDHSLTLPPREYFSSAGIPLVISRFDDDRTHKDLPSRSDLCEVLVRAGASVEVSGVIRYPWLEEELLAHWQRGAADAYALQAAFWSRTKWSQFVIGSV